MRFTVSEKLEIIRLVEESDLSARQTLKELGIARATFNKWYSQFRAEGSQGLQPRNPKRKHYWNKIPDEIRGQVVDLALEEPDLSPRELACRMTDQKHYFISESSAYRILKKAGLITSPAYILIQAAKEFVHQTRRVNELWQTDFTYLKIVNWGWYYLSTVLDDFSRYILSWELSPNMCAPDAERTIARAIRASRVKPEKMPKLLSDNGSCYISHDLAIFLQDEGIKHLRGQPYHPQTQGKIERYHRTMKNVIKLENYYSPDELRLRIGQFVDYYNNHRYHESLQNLTPADVYFGRAERKLQDRKRIKEKTLKQRWRNYRLELHEVVTT